MNRMFFPRNFKRYLSPNAYISQDGLPRAIIWNQQTVLICWFGVSGLEDWEGAGVTLYFSPLKLYISPTKYNFIVINIFLCRMYESNDSWRRKCTTVGAYKRGWGLLYFLCRITALLSSVWNSVADPVHLFSDPDPVLKYGSGSDWPKKTGSDLIRILLRYVFDVYQNKYF